MSHRIFKKVQFAQPVAVFGGQGHTMPLKDTKSGDGLDADVIALEFPNLYVRTKRGAEGITTIFNIVSREVDAVDLEQLTAPLPSANAAESAPSARRRG